MRLFFACTALVIAGCEPSGDIPVHKEPPLDALPETPSGPVDPPLTDAQRATLDGYLDAQFKSHGWPSMAIGVVFGDTLVYEKHLGAEHPVYRIGSVTKVMTGVALLQLRDRGKLQLDDSVTRYVPELTAHAGVTLRHLVNHTSGIPSIGDGSAKYWTGAEVSEAQLLAAIKNAPLEFTPGTRVAYSNFAVALAGVVIARVSGEPYRDVMDGSVLGPLKMIESGFEGTAKGMWLTATGYAPATTTFRLGAAEAAGGLYSTLSDVAKFLSFEARAESDRIDLESVLSRESLRESQRVVDPKVPPFGINWATGKNDLGAFVAHNGSVFDYSASVQLYPARKAAIVALLSTGNYEQLDCVAQNALGALFRESPPGACTPSLSEANQTALTRVKALFGNPNAPDIDAAFSATFPVSRADLLKFFQDCNAAYGACTDHAVLATADNGTARARLTCAKANANVLIGADARTKLIDTLFVAK